MPRVLIVAAGGRVARRVAAGLCARGEPPRALVRVEIAFLALGSSLQQVELEQRFIDVATEVGLPHLVKLSAAGARSDGVAPVLRWHAAIESHISRQVAFRTPCSVHRHSRTSSRWPHRRYAR